MSKQVTAANLYAIARGAKPEIVDAIVANQDLIAAAGFFDDPDLRNHFFVHLAHESSGFTSLEESLFYTSAARIRQVWPSRFPTEASAQRYVRNQRALANNVYGGRLGNVGPDDGWQYRGSGPLQTTGLVNFREAKAVTGIDVVTNPELLREQVVVGLKAAIGWWKARPALITAASNDNIVQSTQIINGGQNGIADRRERLARAKLVNWGEEGAAPAQDDFIRAGDKGEKVVWVQKRLQAHRFYLGGHLDGDFGGGTTNEVKAFQLANGLIADGVVGPATQRALNADPAPSAMPPPAPTPEVIVVEAPPRPPEPPTMGQTVGKAARNSGILATIAALIADNAGVSIVLAGLVGLIAVGAVVTVAVIRHRKSK